MFSAKIDEQRKVLIITLDLQEPTVSASGKSIVVASTHGNQSAGISVKDDKGVLRPLTIGVNAYLRAK